MTGAQHYKEAERLAEIVNRSETAMPDRALASAQVHATLALAAATALDGDYRAFAEWAEVAQP